MKKSENLIPIFIIIAVFTLFLSKIYNPLFYFALILCGLFWRIYKLRSYNKDVWVKELMQKGIAISLIFIVYLCFRFIVN